MGKSAFKPKDIYDMSQKHLVTDLSDIEAKPHKLGDQLTARHARNKTIDIPETAETFKISNQATPN